jgi:hypothetical protein
MRQFEQIEWLGIKITDPLEAREFASWFDTPCGKRFMQAIAAWKSDSVEMTLGSATSPSALDSEYFRSQWQKADEIQLFYFGVNEMAEEAKEKPS